MSRGAESIAAVATLSDTLRRTLYEFIRRQPHPVSRDEAAEHAGISRRLAAFHLDKLTKSGLLRSRDAPADETRRPGRRPKVYEPADAEFEVSVPQRHYDLVGAILVDAIGGGNDDSPAGARTTAFQVAEGQGEAMGAAARTEDGPRHPPGPERALSATARVLTGLGYEPHRTCADTLRLRNCPFHRLAERDPALVCGLNQAFVGGLLRGLGTTAARAVLAPVPGQCCVEVRAARAGNEETR